MAAASHLSWRDTKTVRVQMRTNLGDLEIDVFTDRAPISSEQFLDFVEEGCFDGAIFWRVVTPANDHSEHPIQVVQVHADTPDRLIRKLPHEPTVLTGVRHLNGTLSLARLEAGTATAADFFICVGDQPSLDYRGQRNPDGFGFAAFGQVVEGMEVVHAIHHLATVKDAEDAIRNQTLRYPVVIESARIGVTP